MDDIIATSTSGLINTLRRVDITAPSRTEGITTEHCERWSMCRLLATLAKNNAIEYPLRVHHQDKPDFKLQVGHAIIGVEVTEAIPQDYAAVSALREREKPEAIIDISEFRWGMRTKTLKELRGLISQDKLTGQGWEGDSVEREWAQAIWEVTQNKLQKFNSRNFQRFSINWLLIYDNLPLPMPKLKIALRYLSEKFSTYWDLPEKFDAIFVERRSEIVKLTSGGSLRWGINNLWKGA